MNVIQDSGDMTEEVGNGVPIPTTPAQPLHPDLAGFFVGMEAMFDRKLEKVKQELIIHFTNQGEGRNVSGFQDRIF